jgi:hypothetical protein
MIPFKNTDPRYLKLLDHHANLVREEIKSLKMLISINEDEQSPAYVMLQQHHDQWKKICSQTAKSIRAVTRDAKVQVSA